MKIRQSVAIICAATMISQSAVAQSAPTSLMDPDRITEEMMTSSDGGVIVPLLLILFLALLSINNGGGVISAPS